MEHSFVVCCVVLALLSLPRLADSLSVSASFNQRGVRGAITFSQLSPGDNTTIAVSLSGLAELPGASFPWHVHQYPSPQGILTPCAPSVTGGHYDPLGVGDAPGYRDDCAADPARCEVGDLSGRHGRLTASPSPAQFTDPALSLFGVFSVVGRSIVIHDENGTRLLCANIGYPTTEGGVLYSQFRDEFAGNIYFRQHGTSAGGDGSSASVYVDLVRYNESAPTSEGHNWHVHESPINPGGDCSSAGSHYNPRGVDASSEDYPLLCNTTSHASCEVGDLSSKGAPLSVVDGVSKLFYTDTDLPLVGGGISIVDRSVVIHGANRAPERISCTNLTTFNPLEAVAYFNESGVTGNIRFVQTTPFDATQIVLSLTGLGGRAEMFGIYEAPRGPPSSRQPCGVGFTGLRYNPTGVEASGAFNTSDAFEVGDLSGKFRDLTDQNDVSESFVDPNVPLFGSFNVIGRSVVICGDDMVGSRWLCADIQHVRTVVRVTVTLSSANLSGVITFIQPADDPFADTTIIVEIDSFPVLPVIPDVSSVVMVTTSFLAPTPSVQPSLSSAPIPSQIRSTSLVPVPSSTPVMFGSGTDCETALLPCDSASEVLVSPTPMARRRRRRRRSIFKRQTADMQFAWSLRSLVGGVQTPGSTTPADCLGLPLVGVAPSMATSPAQCSQLSPLACAGGDLTGKHGALSVGASRGVYSDPSLPLSGPNAVFSGAGAVLLIQPLGGVATDADSAVCQVGVVTPPTTITPTSSSSVVSTSASPSPSATPLPGTDNTVLIGAVVGGVGGALLLVVVVVVVIAIVCCVRRRGRSSKYELSKKTELEMGTLHPSQPLLGVPHYRALHDYTPLSNGDLALTQGDWVTLVEAPYGGEWWRGKCDGGEGGEGRDGWFPKNYVELVDVTAEKRRIQEDNFKLAAAAIVAASSSFSAHHPSMVRKPRIHDNKQARRSHTISKMDIDSTPKTVAKFNKPYLERNDSEGYVIENATRDTDSGSQPSTPQTPRGAEIIANTSIIEAGSSQESYDSVNSNQLNSEPVSPVKPVANGNVLHIGTCVAKFDFSGSTDIELQLKKDDVVTIIERAGNGWCKGVCAGRVGWFPESYVRFTPSDNATSHIAPPKSMADSLASGEVLEVTEYRALYEYRSDTDGDLVFDEGETVLVYWSNESGWWFGSACGNQGWFPCSFVEPIIDLSEAASSASALSNQEPHNEVGGDGAEVTGFANEIAEAARMRKARKSSSKERSSFKRKWSLRKRSRDRGSEAEDQPVPALGSESPALHGELAVALERRNSLPRDRQLSIDNEVAMRRQQKSSETEDKFSRTELFSAFIRRSLKRKPSDPPPSSDHLPPPSTDDTPLPQSSITAEADDVFPEAPPTTDSGQASAQQGEVATPTKLADAPVGEIETQVEGAVAMMSEDTSSHSPPLKPTPRKATINKPRRHAPPPPANASPRTKAPPTTPPTASQAARPLRVETPPTPSGQAQRSPHLPSVGEQTTPTSSNVKHQQQPDVLARSYTTAMGRPGFPVAQPRPRGIQQRRTTAAAAGSKAKPRRRPPPPPPQTPPTSVSRPQPAAADPARKGKEEEDGTLIRRPVAQARKSTPSVEMRPRVQRVKRPASRMIPPPPNIPLPPRPNKEPFSETDSNTNRSSSLRRVTGPPPVVPPRDYIPVTKHSPQQRGPKPAPPARTSSLSGRGHFKIRRTISNVPEDDQTDGTEKKKTDAAAVEREKPQDRVETEQPQRTEPPPQSSREDSSKVEEGEKVVPKERTISNYSATKSRPPGRPPPPRPASVASKLEEPVKPVPETAKTTPTTRLSVSENQASAVESKTLFDISKQSGDPDELANSGSFSIKAKGSSLMRSLRKMVGSKSDAKKGPAEVLISYPTSRDTKPQRPPPPAAQRASLKPEEQKDDVKSEEASSEIKASSEEEIKPHPSRPPPPSASKDISDSSTAPAKSPSPEPPATSPDDPQSKPDVGQIDDSSSTKPVPAPRASIKEPPAQVDSEPLEAASKPVAAPRKSVSPPPPPVSVASPVPTSADSKSPESNFYRATSAYEAVNDDELSFSEGDVLIIITRGSDGDFHYGMLDDGTTGKFPVSHVQPFFSKK